jgi:hypothetical protein
MIGHFLNSITRGLSMRAFYALWTRLSIAAMILWAAVFNVVDTWIAYIGLMLLLVLLLFGGILLLVTGLRDVVRDLRHSLHVRSEKDVHGRDDSLTRSMERSWRHVRR